jgi:hypothetical protein
MPAILFSVSAVGKPVKYIRRTGTSIKQSAVNVFANTNGVVFIFD